MTTGNRKVEFNLEEKLAQLDMSPSERAQALGALRVAEDMADFFEAVRAGFKRVAAVLSLRPSVRT